MSNSGSLIQDYINMPLNELMERADTACRKVYGSAVFIRGLLEVTNYCTMNCAYCGIRRDNAKLLRYRMSNEEILQIIKQGLHRGIKSFVLQGGVDPEFQGSKLIALADDIRNSFGSDFALTFSFGVLSYDTYRALFAAGVNRYLLRFETADATLHEALKGTELSERIRAFMHLKEIGYEAGTGFMTGLPGDSLSSNLELLASLEPDMIGIGPFIPHPETPLKHASCQGLEPTLRAVAISRLLFPYANIPATTAAGTIEQNGRELALSAGANVVMPNIGTKAYKQLYELYPGKICVSEDGFSCISCLSVRIRSVNKNLDYRRGNSRGRV
ncbi:MAG TPA: [FeFe] hydrogenase H-cluster radical SAM maturase HydE [Spirochaetales bacterium]|nr:[FeFe] hydrogenase H-cluster radical SAM maturase HydE [Spirochaetales bacterium]